jgi:hypothetical protein
MSMRRVKLRPMDGVAIALAALVLGVAGPAAGQFVAIDLHPSGFAASFGSGVGDGQQAGYGAGPMTGNEKHALLWSGTADSVVDLHPNGFTSSQASGASGGQQAGYGVVGGASRALLWTGTADSVVDLNPSGFVSAAWAVGGGQQAGEGAGPMTGNQQHALLWSCSADSVVDLHAFLPPGCNSSFAFGIDVDGTVVGQAARPEWHAFLWRLAR